MRSFPGARWWRFDFHTHTPASRDTTAWQRAKGTPDEVTPERWLLQFMAAEVDCVAVTDHNSGDWVDALKAAYVRMKTAAETGGPDSGFRPLTLFPGVEISAQGGVHVLAIFGPDASGADIDGLLGRVQYDGAKGDSDGVTRLSLTQVLEAIVASGALAIPAHADQDKGLLRTEGASRRALLDANTLHQALGVSGLLAVEWRDQSAPWPDVASQSEARLSRVLGSDCHSFQGAGAPGERFTWVKMATPTLEGLRLALLDGNGSALRRSDEEPLYPSLLPEHWIGGIEVEEARYMGRGHAATVKLSPYLNAIVGGRGTGKSTFVHALRLATRRTGDTDLGQETEARRQFEAFRQLSSRRGDEGALRQETKIKVLWHHEERDLELSLTPPQGRSGEDTVVVMERRDAGWTLAESQAVNPARFPLRIFSQGQIAALAEEGRGTLLGILDESAGLDAQKRRLEEEKATFRAMRAGLRAMDQRLAEHPEVERRLGETHASLERLARTNQEAVLRAYARATHQQREVRALADQVTVAADAIDRLDEELVLEDWNSQYFGAEDADILAWRAEVERELSAARQVLEVQAQHLRARREAWKEAPGVLSWYERAQAATQAYQDLQQQLAAQGVQDPQAFARLTAERQRLELQQKDLVALQGDRAVQLRELEGQFELVSRLRAAITEARAAFLARVLESNEHVRIRVVEHGFDPRNLETQLRSLLSMEGTSFDGELLGTEENPGLARTLAAAEDKRASLNALKRQLIQGDPSFGGRFANALAKRRESPEFADHIAMWFPEDDLQIEYRRGGWQPISHGSQGQRSAALLAFLLSFGDEPLVLDQPEDDLDNHLIYDLIVTQLRENKLRRQLIVVTHNPNIVVNGDAELVHVMAFARGQCVVHQSGALQEREIRKEVCTVMEGGREAFSKRWQRLGREG
ncbi:MAG: AAA family ATPase [Deltaproteobacteria bacterium]|nr:AAA family ATPase [Deltaproteobacteria bacterium]